MLDPKFVAIVKETAPIVGQHARDITEYFYEELFERYPQVKPLFNQSHQANGVQRQALANAVVAYALNIDQLENLGPAVKLIANKHASLGIKPEHYPLVGEVLLDAIKAVLKDVITDEILAAWGAAYGQLAEILIGAEEELYQEHASRAGGWDGFKAFRIARIEQESDIIKSFYLENTQNRDVIDFRPGQYIAVRVLVDGVANVRNYSLSDAPGKEYLRISVKQEEGGLVSNYLHSRVSVGDEIEISPPSGEFVLRENQRPLFLVTGGVGLTPAISMLNHALNSNREIHFIHAAQNQHVHAFRDHVNQLCLEHSNVNKHFVYNQATENCEPDSQGYITEGLLERFLPENRNADVYFLGPKPFMRSINQALRNLDVPQENTFYEFFGPASELEHA